MVTLLQVLACWKVYLDPLFSSTSLPSTVKRTPTHELIHAWNGKYRRPSQMVVDTFQAPLGTELLWIYEGLTQYLTFVLCARSGLWTREETLQSLAWLASINQAQKGRSWRALSDTALSAQTLYRARTDWSSWRRGVDFYDEGVFLWLEVDAILRQETKGRQSLDDFCRNFFGGHHGQIEVKPYDLEDVVAALGEIADYDWKQHFEERVYSPVQEPPLAGLALSGWRLDYSTEPTAVQAESEQAGKFIDLRDTIGLVLGAEGEVQDVIPQTAADQAGMMPTGKLIAVNGRRFSAASLRAAIASTEGGETPLELLIENGDEYRSFSLDYRAGARYPRLARDEAQPDLLAEILRPRSPQLEVSD